MGIEDVLARVNKTFGDGAVAFGGGAKTIPRVPLGVPELDIALGGGIPMGRNTLFRGDASGGKSLLMYRALANARRICRRCFQPFMLVDPFTREEVRVGCAPDCKAEEPMIAALVEPEGSFTQDWYRTLGGDPDFLLVNTPASAEEAADVGETLLRSGEVDILGLDSIASLASTNTIEASAGKANMAPEAQVATRMYKKWQAAMNLVGSNHPKRVGPAVITVNQKRFKVGVVYGSPITYPGGEALNNFFPGVRVDFATKEQIKPSDAKGEDDTRVVGRISAFVVNKNKTAPPWRRGQIALYFERDAGFGVRPGDTDFAMQIMRIALAYGIVTKSGSWYSLLSERLGQGEDKALAALRDRGLAPRLYDAVLRLDASGWTNDKPLPSGFKL